MIRLSVSKAAQHLYNIRVPYASHCNTHNYNPRFVYFIAPFFTVVYVVEQLVLEIIYVLNEKILPFLGLKSAFHNQESCFKSGVGYNGAHTVNRIRIHNIMMQKKAWCKKR